MIHYNQFGNTPAGLRMMEVILCMEEHTSRKVVRAIGSIFSEYILALKRLDKIEGDRLRRQIIWLWYHETVNRMRKDSRTLAPYPFVRECVESVLAARTRAVLRGGTIQ